MSILNVEHLTHGFGDRAIFTDVSFRLLKGEHIGLVGANGEGKSTFMNIVTGKLMPDEGKIEWSKNVHAGYLDQHAVLKQGMTIREVLKSAFDPLLQKEIRMNEICDLLGTADEEEMNLLMEELGTIQDELTLHDFYTIDAKVEEVARALGLLDLGLDRDVTDLSGGQRTKVLLAKLLLEKPDILLLDEPTNYLDEEHIAWLKRYLLDYENAFILISHDIPFLNEVVNIIYHMENQELNRYVGDYNHFQEVYAVKKAQLEAAYRRQQQEISELKDFVARNKARVSTRTMAMSRQKKLDKMDLIELAGENTCIEELWQEFPSCTQYEIRSALAKCGLTTKHIESQVRVLSGGEQAKVRLCKLLNRDTNLLLLDEPTNHLDVDAKDSLKKALQEYRGSILLICHEPEFYEDVVDEVWDMSQWTTKIF